MSNPTARTRAAARGGSAGRYQENRETRAGWWMVSPALLVFLIVAVVPLGYTLYYSLTDYRFAEPGRVPFVGLENYQSLFLHDPGFVRSIINTVIFTVSTVSLEAILGLIIALVLNSQFRGRGLVRAAVLVPWAIPTVVSSQLWRWMLDPRRGPVDDLLMRLGAVGEPVYWLAQPVTAMAAIVMVDVWKTTPFMALLLLAGLQVIPDELYQAAAVDGATPWRRFWTITLPLLTPALLVALIFRTLDALRVFDIVHIMTRGAFNTETMAFYAQRAIVNNGQLGYGSAMSVVIFAMIAVFVAVYLTLFRVRTN